MCMLLLLLSYIGTVSMHMRDLFVRDIMDQSMPYVLVCYAQEPIHAFSIDPNFISKAPGIMLIGPQEQNHAFK